MRILAIALVSIAIVACAPEPQDNQSLIAIDVLLEPDQTMLRKSSEWNARLRELTPEGFELDESHQPHITLIQRHVRRDDLDEVLVAVESIARNFDIESLALTAVGLYHIPVGDLGLAGITIEPTEELLTLQRAVVDAVNPYDAGAADEDAYVADPSGTPFDPFLFEYVELFVPDQTGANFNPHVTVGLAPTTWLAEQESQPFSEFQFGADGLAVYQLGNFGTAARRLER